MKTYVILIPILLSVTTGIAQENKAKLAIGISNTFMNCFEDYADLKLDLTVAGLGVDIKKPNANFRLYAAYGFNTNIRHGKNNDSYYLKSFSYKSHLLGLIFECHYLNEKKRFRPFIGVNISSEIATNYKNGYIDYNDFIFTVEPTVDSYQYAQFPSGSTYESTTYKSKFYQSMPLASLFYTGCNIKIIENLNLNLSVGYALNLMKYKYVVWQDRHDSGYPAVYGFHNAFERSPLQILAMRSITGQLGLNYAFSFKKEK